MVERMIAATDGAATPNPGPTGWAWVLADSEETPLRGESGFLGPATNNVGELTAVHQLLLATDPAVPMEIRVDSEYVKGVVTAHQADGDALNAVADHTATQAVDDRQGRSWTGTAPSPNSRPATPPARPRPAASTRAAPSQCQATGKNGAPCGIEPRPSGLCHLHDPEVQCQAITKSGRRCGMATGGRGRCKHHQDQLM